MKFRLFFISFLVVPTALISYYFLVPFPSAPPVETTLGTVVGSTLTFRDKAVYAYLGIPYAKPPVGDLRFKVPEPAEKWTGVYNATKSPNSCYQSRPLFNYWSSEDCLYLSIYTPAERSSKPLKPVMVFIHGGGFKLGSGNPYTGRMIVALGDVVMVNFNYRLGPLGFLTSATEEAPGNMGLLDQILALKWIRANIKSFGGDPDEITLFGESAGSISVHVLLMSPLSKGLFKKAIMQSGVANSIIKTLSSKESVKRSSLLASKVGCGEDLETQPSKVVHCLRTKSPADMVSASEELFIRTDFPFSPIYNDKNVLPFKPDDAARKGLFHKVPLLIGTNTHEFSFFLPKPFGFRLLGSSWFFNEEHIMKVVTRITNNVLFNQAKVLKDFYLPKPEYTGKEGIRKSAVDILTDRSFVCPSVYLAEYFAEAHGNVFMYQYAHLSEWSVKPSWMGTPHGEELLYLFGFPLYMSFIHTAKDQDMSLTMIKMWTDFAKSGKPVSDVSQWPLYNRSTQIYAKLYDGKIEPQVGPRKEFCDYWRDKVND